MLWMFQRVMFGPLKNEENQKLKDLSFRELVVLAPLVAAIFGMGIFPNFFFEKLEPSIHRLVVRSSGVLTNPVAKTTDSVSAVALIQGN